MNDFMQYKDPDVITEAQANALTEYGQFYSSVSDFKFLARLRAAKCKRHEIDEWFDTNSKRMVWYLAQGILASVYGEDPP